MTVDLTKDIPAILESAYLATSGPIKGYFQKSVTQAVPSVVAHTATGDAGSGVCASVIFAATTTVTGAAVGDIVVVGMPTVALTGLKSIYGVVTLADTVQLYAEGLPATAVTGASKTFVVSVIDVT